MDSVASLRAWGSGSAQARPRAPGKRQDSAAGGQEGARKGGLARRSSVEGRRGSLEAARPSRKLSASSISMRGLLDTEASRFSTSVEGSEADAAHMDRRAPCHLRPAGWAVQALCPVHRLFPICRCTAHPEASTRPCIGAAMVLPGLHELCGSGSSLMRPVPAGH